MRPTILGILNITEDSFSDGGCYLDYTDAINQGQRLLDAGADILDLGAAASNPSARPVPSTDEIARLGPVMECLLARGASLCVDSFATETQRFAISAGAEYLNDIRGFPDPNFYPELAKSSCHLIVMHSSQRGPATLSPEADSRPMIEQVFAFFNERVAALLQAGITRQRLILDPGMGLFLGTNANDSVLVLQNLQKLRTHFGIPILVSTSRKSFLRKLSGAPLEQIHAATLASELFAANQGARYIRTHEPGPLRHTLAIWNALTNEQIHSSD